MATPPPKKLKVWVPLIVSFILLLGFALGVVTQKYLTNTKPLEKFLSREDPIDEIISLVHNEYIDSFSKDSLYREAVNGILAHLDPHTVYIPASQLVQANQILEGTDKGLGIEYFFFNDTMLVTSISEKSPAEKAGLRIGDKLLKVNGVAVSGPGIKEEEAVLPFRASDTLSLLVLHPDEYIGQPIEIVKGEIKNQGVSAALLLNNKVTGYIKIDIFSAGVYEQATAAIKELKEKGMKQLIIDLRNNGGGYLEEATSLADELIGGQKTIVSVSSKRDGQYEFNSYYDGAFENGNLVILINENSASASEVLAGAVQDWDRGVIIGNNSFGKGLIQEQFDLSDGSALRLTTGRYFTPSGRSIQRPYGRGKAAYEEDYYQRLKDTSTGKLHAGTVFYTKTKHRAIFGNGGIFPDIIVKNDLKPSTGELQKMIDNLVLEHFVQTFYFTEFKKVQYSSFFDFKNRFEVDEEFMEKMRQYFIREDAIYTERIWNDPLEMRYLRIESKALLAKLAFGVNAYNLIHIDNDDCIFKALEVLNSDVYSKILQPSTHL